MHNDLHSFSSGTCSKYRDTTAVAAALKGKDKDRALVAQFLQFFELFKAHEDSLRLEKNLDQVCEEKSQKLIEAGQSPAATKFLERGFSVLKKCRQILMYTYSFAFYIAPGPQRDVFQQNQGDLHKHIEVLSG